MEDQSLADVLIQFISSFETLIAVMIGACIGFFSNLFTLMYRSRKEEKELKREKLEEVYNLTNNERAKVNSIFNGIATPIEYNFDVNLELDKKNIKEFSLTKVQLLVDLYFDDDLNKNLNELKNARDELQKIHIAIYEERIKNEVPKSDSKIFKELLEKKIEVNEQFQKFIDNISSLSKEIKKSLSNS